MYARNHWKDRSVENPTRFEVTDNGDGTSEITPEPGEVYEAGTPLTQARLNKLESAMSDAYAALMYVLAYVRRALAGKASGIKHTVTLPTSGWSGTGPYTYAASVADVSESNVVLAGPAPASKAAYETCDAYPSAQGNETLTFTATIVPAVATTVNVVIFNSIK
jgi:hypothetical protein